MNIAPDNITAPSRIKSLNKAATRWLSSHDPDTKKTKRIAKLRKQRAARQTRVHRLK